MINSPAAAGRSGFRAWRILAGLVASGVPWLHAQPAAEGNELPTVAVTSTRVANQYPAGTLAMPVSGLRFEPRVDVQSRNLAEAQADVAVRGGHFENTGIKLGSINLMDPQTGHYLTELPVSPEMLVIHGVVTGARNAADGFNAGAGTIAYGWRPTTAGGRVSAGVGEDGFRAQSLYQGFQFPGTGGGKGAALGADFAWARSASDGSVPSGDHEFEVVTGRLQRRSDRAQTDIVAGYQAKFFGWPNLYTPFGFNETENLQTVLVVANHRAGYGRDSWFELGAYYRRNKDDYEFNRAVPGASNPFQHTTHAHGAAIDGRHAMAKGAMNYRVSWFSDRLESTALTFGRYHSRELVKFTVVPEIAADTPAGKWVAKAGASADWSNRDGEAFSPILSLARHSADGQSRVYVEYSGATQVTSYTALNSNPNAGLFRGNAGLARTTSRNAELGIEHTFGGWQLEAAVFHRQDDDLVDWTFRQGVTARTANPVDIATLGLEAVVVRHYDRLDLVLGYSWLGKNADYRQVAIDGSFYALNFARHRLTAAVTCRLAGGWSVRVDNEYRVQHRNPLRRSDPTAFLTEAAVALVPPQLPQLEVSLQVANLWDDDFEEVPAVPAARRQIAFTAAWRW